jgi:hypothetical protein
LYQCIVSRGSELESKNKIPSGFGIFETVSLGAFVSKALCLLVHLRGGWLLAATARRDPMIAVALSLAPTVNVRSDFVGANATGGFIQFGYFSHIIEKWQLFEDIVPSQHWLKQRMDELEKTRHFIAHNRALLPSEYQRVYMYIMYIADWNRVVGL